MRSFDPTHHESSALPSPIGDALERSHIGFYDLLLGGLTGLAVLAAVSVGIAKPTPVREAQALKTASQAIDCPLADLSCAYAPGAVMTGAGF